MKNAGTALTEILNIPDDIPQDLLDKADCVVVFPSVLKAAFVVGGSYGRGAMTCRTGETFTAPGGAPSMMALEGGSVGFQIGGRQLTLALLREQEPDLVFCDWKMPTGGGEELLQALQQRRRFENLR